MKWIIPTLILSSCSSVPYQNEHWLADKNFTYVYELRNKPNLQDPTRRFEGNCTDFAFAMCRWIGGQVEQVSRPDGYHNVCTKDGYVYDFNLPIMDRPDYVQTTQAVFIATLGE